MYKIIKRNQNIQCIFRIEDNASIPLDEANTDYQEYLEWLAEGNTPEEAEDFAKKVKEKEDLEATLTKEEKRIK